MPEYRVIFEIEVEAKTPKDAAILVDRWLKEAGEDWLYDVTGPDGIEHSIDMSEIEFDDDDYLVS